MTDLIAAEFLKLRTTRTFWWLTGSGIVLGALITVAQLATSDVSDASEARSLLSNATTVFIFLVLLGVVGTAGEYRHGTITTTLLGAPDRLRFVLAKALACGAGRGEWRVRSRFSSCSRSRFPGWVATRAFPSSGSTARR